ncbi:MAG: hypothetical protein ABSH48_26385 [Verrucomicrobiota bacterium]
MAPLIAQLADTARWTTWHRKNAHRRGLTVEDRTDEKPTERPKAKERELEVVQEKK